MADPSLLGKAEDEVVEVMRRRRHVPAAAKNDFEISSPDIVADLWKQLTGAIVIPALVFIVPRARAVGMNIPLWVLAVGLTASISLLPMVARLFWLEKRGSAAA